ncbi:ABC transporter ATP-binding protein [Candidatus Magnetomonas plexicatena]|uniref:ABC transporter ATP-binding protein n=1 Tax=Candidatus Magnetomonas plexicatena TaxID=2552947 RepID=UPI001C76C13D|nr:ABC transporter ATP-binding protein [Nitrospirales bacterium LBB_01]
MIELTELTKQYIIGKEKLYALDNVNLTVEKGDFVSIVGHSGSGKTTLLSIVGALTKPDIGTVKINGTNLWAISDNELSELRNKLMNFIFQFASLIPTLTVLENVILPTAFAKEKIDKSDYAMSLLKMVKIEDKANLYPSQLSGGQQRRVAIARAFINEPEIMLADEPTGDLDEETEAEIMALFRRMNEDKGITFLLVTHSSEIAKQCKKIYRMTHGVLKPF